MLTAAALIDPQFLKDNSVWVIVAAFTTLLLVALYEWLKASGHENGGGVTQTTSGPQSSNYGSVQGDVHNYYGPPNPAARQEPKLPRGSGYNWDNVDALTRIMRGDGTPPGLARFVIDPKPDLNLNGLLVRVYKIIGPPPEPESDRKKFLQRVNREIADKMSLNRLHSWGRVSDDHALGQIDSDDWSNGVFDHRRNVLHVTHEFGSLEYQDLHFYKREIDQHWPEPLETTNDRKP